MTAAGLRTLVLCVMGLSGGVASIAPARADLPEARMDSFLSAAVAAAELDAIDVHCKAAKPGDYARQIALGSARQNGTPAQKKRIEDKAAQVRANTVKKLKTAKQDCADVEFMFHKYTLLDSLDRQIKALIEDWAAQKQNAAPSAPGPL